jgi:predicted transcriptional regulator
LLLNDPQESKVLKQLKDRITTYYDSDEANCMKAILSFISCKRKRASQNKILTELDFSENLIRECLHTLLSESYLIRELETNKRYFSFKYQIVKKWWNINMA